MNTTQQIATAFLAVLMLGTIVMMPPRFTPQATYSASVLRQAGPIATSRRVVAEQPHEQVRDLSFN